MAEIDTKTENIAPPETQEALIDVVLDSWRFAKLFSRAITKLDAGDGARYISQYRYYLKRLTEHLERIDLRLVNIEGQQYDTGMAATALNIADFGPDDSLVVDQMVEPIIMGKEGLVRTGTVILKKVEP